MSIQSKDWETAPPDGVDTRAELEELRTSKRAEQLRHAEELRQFAYAISHDLREPLRMVTSYSQLLERRCQSKLDEDGREFIRYINDGAQRMDRLLGDLLAFSQIRPLEEPSSAVDAEAVLEGVLLNLDRAIQASHAQVTHDPLPRLMFDFGRLSQVFSHLISNSIKFRAADEPRIHVAVKETDNELTFSVTDNGVGIDPRYHEQIFGIFKRLHGREVPGTGIGLAICKRIIEQQDGRIWLESETGKGTTVRFTLPQ